MFKLQRLEITGFKSFADHTEVVFTGNGITAVVGPNGCGKSNVSDAISWVLGEQRAKSLRGAEMKDVVFQGTKNRKPSGMAEVVLHMVRDEDAFDADDAELEDIDSTLSEIDELAVDVDALETATVDALAVDAIDANGFHEDEEVEKVQAAQVGSIQTVERVIKTKRHWRPRSFALDFAPGEAVSVTRRLYLSGESEYLLNGKTCRLRDIQDLFAGTGLSGSHYAIIEQGRIGQILSAKPGDRRNLIEEAAGISKFRTRQRAAEARLETAKSNLNRIGDIVTEVEKNANSLRRQAGKTRRFLAVQEEFRVFQRQYFAAEGRHFESLIAALEARLAEAVMAEKAILKSVAEMEAAARDATQAARAEEETLAAIRQRHADAELERDRTTREHRYQSEQIIELGNRAEALRMEIDALTERIAIVEAERTRLVDEEQRESSDAEAAAAVLLEAEGLFAAKIADVREIESELEKRRSELMQHTAAGERFAETARQLAHNRDRLNERITGLEREEQRAGENHLQHISEAERIAGELTAERAKLESFQLEKAGFLADAEAARGRVADAEEKLKAVQQEYSRVKHRLETLRELDEKRAVYAPEIQKLFAEQDQIGVSLKGVLADFLHVDAGVEKAVESLFGPMLQTVLVDSVEDAIRVSEWLAHEESGRIAALVVGESELEAALPPENSKIIADALGVSAELRTALREIFPREMSARLVDAFDAGSRPGETLVKPNGDILIGGRLFISGNSPADEQNASLLAFKRELSGLDARAAALEGELHLAESTAQAKRATLAEIEEKAVDVQSLIIKVERHILGLESQEALARQEIERADRHRKVVADEIAQAKNEVAEIEARISEAEQNARNAMELRSGAQTDLDAIAISLMKAREVSETENEILNQKRTMAATSAERRRSAQSALRRVENEQKELGSRIAQHTQEHSDTEARIEQLRSSISDISVRISASGDAKEAERIELAEAQQRLAAARENADAVSNALADLNHKASDALNERAAVEVRQTEALTQLKNVNEKCQQELGTALDVLSSAETLPEDFDLAEARSRVEEMRQRLEAFGAINMLAVDELEEAEERLLFLTSQRQDIIDSISSAEEALQEIKERSRERFVQAFAAINANFTEFFQELFGGGRGEMTLLESDDVLEAGIEVVAQPPGKRLQNILLLSGGEKAMTAIALVMAIFKYRPSPFCLLDEVDAPLDDANVGRFVTKIASMAEKTQFIVITHNKRTMEAARALYGVTMQEAGVSKIVSVKFE
ncbi:MAG: chromosome segregation protein SMC [Pyrinomonadaceae bacterium]